MKAETKHHSVLSFLSKIGIKPKVLERIVNNNLNSGHFFFFCILDVGTLGKSRERAMLRNAIVCLWFTLKSSDCAYCSDTFQCGIKTQRKQCNKLAGFCFRLWILILAFQFDMLRILTQIFSCFFFYPLFGFCSSGDEWIFFFLLSIIYLYPKDMRKKKCSF